MKKPVISIVTICYNSAATIEETMQSIIGQGYPLLDYVIIDGGSTDGTLDIVERYKDKLGYFCSEPDNGISDAFNKGINSVATWFTCKLSGYTILGDVFINSLNIF